MDERAPTILCVDDDLALLDLLQEFFTLQGFRVLTAMNGLHALLHVKLHRPRAVLLDLGMPRLGGLDTVRRIQRLDPTVVVILISGLPDLLDRVNAAKVNVTGVFTKPVDLARISETLVRAGVAPARTRLEGKVEELSAQARRLIRKRMLVVDDEPDFRETLVEYLRGKGFDVVQAGDGEEAIRRFTEYHPHMVLLDIQMRGLNGVETLMRITALRQQTCVIMVSGLQHEAMARRTLALGAADYIRKPVDFAYLDRVLDTHLLMAEFGPDANSP